MSTTISHLPNQVRWVPSFATRVAPALLAVWLLSISCLHAQDIHWYPDIASAKQAAQEENKLIFLHFTATWCRPCKTLDTFVFTNQSVQRTFAQNVAAVKIDVDQNTHLVEEYGVSSVPYDVAVTPAGRIVSKRKSPRDATAYQKMVGDFSSIIADLADGESPALAQSLSELEELMQNKQPKFEGQPTSFTPAAPSYQRPQPSREAAELDRKRHVTNPYVQQPSEPAPTRVANAFHPAQDMNPTDDNIGPAPAQSPSNNFVPPNDFTPKSFVPDNFAPQMVTGNEFSAPANNAFPSGQGNSVEGNFTPQTPNAAPQQQIQINPYANRAQPVAPRNTALKRLEQSEVAAKLIREKAQQKLDAFKAEAKVVMDDKFFGAPTPKQFKNPTVTGNYQAKINLPKPAHDFLPPEPPSFGDVNAKIVLNSDFENDPASNKDQSENQPQRTKAMKASSAKVISENDSNDPIARGLELASEQTTSPQYALHGKCPITLLQDSKWVDGDPKIGCVHRNRIYIFTNEANLKAFQSDPDANSPILAGYDPVDFQETGRLVDGLEKHGVFMGKPPQQRIVLFATAETRARFQSQPKKYLEAVRQAMKSTGASSKLLR